MNLIAGSFFILAITSVQCGKEEEEGVKYANKCEGKCLENLDTIT